MPFNNLAYSSERREDRDEVHCRVRAIGDGGTTLTVVVVNISRNGLMARCDAALAPGSQLAFVLPGLAPVNAEVRWSLGGRIGCEFEHAVPPAAYYALLPKLRG